MLGRYLDLGNPVADHPLNEGLVAWWLGLPHNSGSKTIFDLCRKYDGTLTASNGFVPRAQSQFLGLNTSVANSTSSVVPTAFPSTLAATVIPTSAGGGLQSAVCIDGGGGWAFIGILVGGNFGTSIRGGSDALTSSGVAATNNVPTRLLASFENNGSGTNLKIYVDGLLKVSTSVSPVAPFPAFPSATRIGSRSGSFNGFAGQVHDVRIYNKVVTDDDAWGDYWESKFDHPDLLKRYSPRVSVFGGYVAGGGFSDATGSSSLTFAASAAGSSLASATGSSSITFTPTAAGSPLADATGTASLAFTVSATGSALADADGSSALTFTPTAAGSALADVTGAATLTFTPSAVGSALADTAGSVALTFAASATGSSQIDATGAATLAFAASAVGSSLADAAGTATLTFTASASSGGFEDATGSATLTFTVSAAGSALVSAAGSAALAFTASAAGSSLADATGAATLTFSCSAVSSDGSQVAALEITATLTTLLSLTVSVASALNLDVTVTDQFDVEEQGMPSPQVGDIGTPIVVTVRDVAGEIMPLGTTTLRQVILSRRGVTRTYSASLYTDGADGKIVYTSQDGDFDVAGPWLARGRVEFGGGAQHWTSPPVNFTVEGA